MASQTQDTSGRAGRLAGLFRNVLKGNRKITIASDARLFFEAVQAQHPPSTCLEELVASKHGLEALQLSARADMSPTFIKSQTLPFIGYLADEQLKLLANGQILQKVLVALIKPPTLWNAIVSMAKTGGLEDEGFKLFSWLCLKLLSLPDSAELEIQGDVEALSQGGKFINAQCPETRRFGYKIQHSLQLRRSPIPSGGSYAPGGRHDNDFADFRQISVFPTTDEFMSLEKPFYRRAKDVFEADMSERPAMHIDNEFRLLREDVLGELRSDWQNTQIRKKGRRSAFILRKLQPIGLHLGDETFRKKCSITVSCGSGLERLLGIRPNQRKKWLIDNKNFLRHQAFGALYQGKEVFGFAFVDRDLDALLSSPPVVVLQFTDEKALKKALIAFKTATDVAFTLVETAVFAYEPVLNRLKEMKELPLQDKLLDPAGTTDNSVFVPPAGIQKIADSLAKERVPVTINIGSRSEPKLLELDYSQQQALKSALTSESSVTVGPPGTGKSFIGALATLLFLQHTDAKILVITYTNHALDQFLEELLDFGIDGNRMVRLGSKFTTRTAPLLLSAQKTNFTRTKESWASIDSLKGKAEEESDDLRGAFRTYLQAQPSFQDIQDYLEFSVEDGRFFEAFQVPSENDRFKKVAKKGKEVKSDYLYNRWRAGSDPGMFQHHAFTKHKEVWSIAPDQRTKLVEKWFATILDEKAEGVQERARRYNHTQSELDVHFRDGKVQLLRQKRIIGCTTTAAAMHSNLISSAGVGIVIVEEAGEIQEPHVLTALTPSVQQLIQIGDHKQLRPKINNYQLTVEKGEGYDLNRSLFERLIIMGHPHTTLQKQHRMHPDISILVKELTYPDLEDGPKTNIRAPLRGLEDRVIFVNHSHPEEPNEKLTDRRDQGAKSSRENLFEAKLILKIVRYLAQQGYATKNMVVLTPYLGQLKLIRDILVDEIDPWLSDLDSYELIQAGLMTQAAANVKKSTLRISTIGELTIVVLPNTQLRGYQLKPFLKTTTRVKKQT